jgi:hypothetical protein
VLTLRPGKIAHFGLHIARDVEELVKAELITCELEQLDGERTEDNASMGSSTDFREVARRTMQIAQRWQSKARK